MLLHSFFQNRDRVRNIVAVANAERQVNTASISGGYIGDYIAPNLSVGDDDHLIVKRDNRCRNDVH
jgi:hypothetical protein